MLGRGVIAAHLSERDVFVAMENPEQVDHRTETIGGTAVCEPRIVRGTVSSWGVMMPTLEHAESVSPLELPYSGGALRASEVCRIVTSPISRPPREGSAGSVIGLQIPGQVQPRLCLFERETGLLRAMCRSRRVRFRRRARPRTSCVPGRSQGATSQFFEAKLPQAAGAELERARPADDHDESEVANGVRRKFLFSLGCLLIDNIVCHEDCVLDS